jgi:hypothetical protein
MAWTYVRALPIWDETAHNAMRKDCFKMLAIHAKAALKFGGMKLGNDRLTNFRSKMKTMMGDFEEVGKCQEALNFLAKK